MLEARPGAFIFVGNGDSAGLHHPSYNFNDEAIPFGTSYWVRLVETATGGGVIRRTTSRTASIAPLPSAFCGAATGLSMERATPRQFASAATLPMRASGLVPQRKISSAGALERRQCRRQPRTAGSAPPARGEKIDLAHLLDVGHEHQGGAEGSSAADHRLPESRERQRLALGRRPWRCARTASDP